jgi:hypothetical protein
MYVSLDNVRGIFVKVLQLSKNYNIDNSNRIVFSGIARESPERIYFLQSFLPYECPLNFWILGIEVFLIASELVTYSSLSYGNFHKNMNQCTRQLGTVSGHLPFDVGL